MFIPLMAGGKMLHKLKKLLAVQIVKNVWLHKAYLTTKRMLGPKPLPEPGSAFFGLLNESQNPAAIAAFTSYCITVEKILPKLRPAQFEKEINSVRFLTAINPVHKDIFVSKRFPGDSVKVFFSRMVSIKPYDLPQSYLFGMMERIETMGAAYMLPAYVYLFSVFQIYTEIGEADRHAEFIEKALEWFVSRPITQERLSLFMRAYSGSSPTSNRQNLKKIVSIERHLLRQYNDLVFPKLRHELPVYARNGKIKIGLLRYNGRGEINFFRPLLDGLPREKYEIHLIVFDKDGVEELQQNYPNLRYHILGAQLDGAVTMARTVGLDILINTSSLSGDLLNPMAALLHYRIAPVQISYCADITTSGIPEMDCFLIGEKLGAKDLQKELVETIFECAGIGFYAPPPLPADDDRNAKRQELEIGQGDIVFASNAHMLKLTPDLLSTWITILSLTQGAKLLLMPFSSDLVTGRFGRSFLTMLWTICAKHNVAEDRIVLSNARGRAAALADLQAADIHLDSFPYSGATSGAEALVSGLPIVTLSGTTMRARYLAAMLAELDIGDIVASHVEDYIAFAVKLANAPEFRQAIKKRIGLAVQDASFFDAGKVGTELDIVLSSLVKNETMVVKDLEDDVV